MKILAIDTTTRRGSAALLDGEAIAAQSLLPPEVSQTESLLPSIEALLKEANWGISELQALACAIGPGSFTGLRVGLATAKGLAQARGLPIVGVSSLLALAHNAVESSVPVAAFLDARRGEVYGALYQFKDNRVAKQLLEEQAVVPARLCTALAKWDSLLLLGDGAKAYENLFREKLGGKVAFGNAGQMQIQAGVVGRLALPRLKKGEGKSWQAMVPNYIRKPDAF